MLLKNEIIKLSTLLFIYLWIQFCCVNMHIYYNICFFVFLWWLWLVNLLTWNVISITINQERATKFSDHRLTCMACQYRIRKFWREHAIIFNKNYTKHNSRHSELRETLCSVVYRDKRETWLKSCQYRPLHPGEWANFIYHRWYWGFGW